MFITLEGIEGCGKSTQVQLLQDYLKENGYPVIATREPGGCDLGDQIRKILLASKNRGMTPSCELFLYAAARAQHVEEVIKPALAQNKIVLCDRFTDATLVYQGYGRGLSIQLISTLNTLATQSLKPHLTLLIDCPLEVGLRRANKRNADYSDEEDESRFENEALSFHQKVKDGYLDLAKKEPKRFVVIDGSLSVDEVHRRIVKEVVKCL